MNPDIERIILESMERVAKLQKEENDTLDGMARDLGIAIPERRCGNDRRKKNKQE